MNWKQLLEKIWRRLCKGREFGYVHLLGRSWCQLVQHDGGWKYALMWKTARWIYWLGIQQHLSRRDSLYPFRCGRCGHICRSKHLIHTYRNDGVGDVEPIDRCPKCREDEYT